jgi:hypothetical protein
MRILSLSVALLGLALAGVSSADSTSAHHCKPVLNPYPSTRYEGVDLQRIRATGVSCHRARQVARGAHRKALGIPPPAGGIRRLSWHGWDVTGDLRGAPDRYFAKWDGKRVSWRF